MPTPPKVILVADDQENMRNLILRTLTLEGYEVAATSNGQGAVDILKERMVDLALLDINMPIVTGIGVVEFMKTSEGLKNIPIIMVTGSVDAESVLKCKALGVKDYLLKPYKLADLLVRIKAALERRAARTVG